MSGLSYGYITTAIERNTGDSRDFWLMQRFELLKGGKLSNTEFEQYKARWLKSEAEEKW